MDFQQLKLERRVLVLEQKNVLSQTLARNCKKKSISVVEIPKSVVFKMPQGRAQPKLGLLWHVTGRNSGVERYVLKTLEPSGVTAELLKGMAPEPQGGNDEVMVELDTVRVFWMPNLRTTLN